ncbi:MAG TPA: protein kinase [Methylomirabilota bacterium]|nr:protein kinase [Methylomirabilota bacterium]
MIGARLAQFEITAKLGEGGMGEVWLADDTRLGRRVALKILPADVAGDAERMARFEREAKVLASLNHPGIAHLYGLESIASDAGADADSDAGRTTFLVMELVEGEDLSARIDRGALPVDEAVAIALQIAEALEAAHEAGIVHRDLKPANVRLTRDGKAKVLDFGLAKALDPRSADDVERSATITSAGTVAGMILGTAAYMSPEQAAGQPTDRRCDIWSFGVILHEMLTGKRLFDGETTSHTLADVLRAPIDLEDLPARVPARVRRLIERCLERDRTRRLRDIGEARIALQDVMDEPEEGPARSQPAAVAAGPATGRLAWAVAAVAAVLATVGFVWNPKGEPASVEPTRRFALEVPNSGNTRQGDGVAVAISSDGSRVVTRGGSGAEDMLHIRHMGSFESEPLENTVNGRNPIFSPDDKWIAFVDAAGLQKIRSTGGPPIFLTQFPSSPSGIDWADDGYIYYANQGEIWRIPEAGGESERLLEQDPIESRVFAEPYMIPGTDTLLCSSRAGAGGPGGELAVFDLKTREITKLDMVGTNPRYLPTGHVLFAQTGRVFIVPFDTGEMRISGQASPVLERAWVDQGQVQADIADNGTVAYIPNTRGETQSLVAVTPDGKVEELAPAGLPFASLNDPRFSPDGRRLMLSVDTGAIWMFDLDTQTPTLMTEEGFYPQWSPDGREVLFGSTRNKTFDIYRRPVDLSRPEALVLDFENNLRAGDWTRQGPVVIREEIPGKGMDLHVWSDPEDPSTLAPLLDGPDDELAPVVSPDGRWLAYVSNYSGVDEIYVTAFPVPGARSKVSMKGGHSPSWAPDGRTLYYVQNSRMVALAIETEPGFRVTGREELFDGEYVHYRWSRQYDVHPSGEYFVMIRNPPRGNVEVITRWFDEIRSATGAE